MADGSLFSQTCSLFVAEMSVLFWAPGLGRPEMSFESSMSTKGGKLLRRLGHGKASHLFVWETTVVCLGGRMVSEA